MRSGSSVSSCNVGYTGDMGSILGSEKPPWRRKWLPTPVCLPGKSHEHRSLLDYSLWGCKELNMSEQLTHRQATANVYSVLLNVHTAHLIPKKKKRIHLQCRRPWFDSWVRKIHWRRDSLLTTVFLGFPAGSAGKESACNARDLGLIPGLGRSPGERKGYPFQYSGLENSMDYSMGSHRVQHD